MMNDYFDFDAVAKSPQKISSSIVVRSDRPLEDRSIKEFGIQGDRYQQRGVTVKRMKIKIVNE